MVFDDVGCRYMCITHLCNSGTLLLVHLHGLVTRCTAAKARLSKRKIDCVALAAPVPRPVLLGLLGL